MPPGATLRSTGRERNAHISERTDRHSCARMGEAAFGSNVSGTVGLDVDLDRTQHLSYNVVRYIDERYKDLR